MWWWGVTLACLPSPWSTSNTQTGVSTSARHAVPSERTNSLPTWRSAVSIPSYNSCHHEGFIWCLHSVLSCIFYKIPCFFFKLDAPKIHGDVAVYTWEGNAVNISCEVQAHPSDVSIVWLRDGLQLPNTNTSNIKIFRTPSSSYLQVNTAARWTSKPQITDRKVNNRRAAAPPCHQDFMGLDLR